MAANIVAMPSFYRLADTNKHLPPCYYRRSLPLPPAPTPEDWNRHHNSRPFRNSTTLGADNFTRQQSKTSSFASSTHLNHDHDTLSDIPEESSSIKDEAEYWQHDISQIRQTTLFVLDEVKRLAQELLDTEQRAQLWQDQYIRVREELRALQKENAQLEMYLIASAGSVQSPTMLSTQQQPRTRRASLVR